MPGLSTPKMASDGTMADNDLADGTPTPPAEETRSGAGSAASRSRKQLLLRLDPDVHAAVAKWAADDLRSVNAQIEVLLRRALKDAGRDPHPAPMRGRGRPTGS